jgi:hypothetical protein
MICVMFKVEGMAHFCHAILEDESYIAVRARCGEWDRDSIVWFRIEPDSEGFWKKAEVTVDADDAALLQGGRPDTDAVRDDV